MNKSKILKATHSGEIKIGDIILPCYVLEDGSRVLTQTGAVKSLGMGQFAQLPKFMSYEGIKPFVSKDLMNFLKNRITFTKSSGGKPSHGYNAIILAEICDCILQARKEGALHKKQLHIAEQCEILTRSFAKVGIIALIDEATGYQEIRDKQALQKILDAYLSKELSAWAKRFPDEFYKEIFRLKGWSYNPLSVKRPSCIGNYTNNIVYDRLAPKIKEELEKLNPKDNKGRRKSRHHQYLTDDIGHPALAQHIYAVMGLMRTQQTWEQFMRFLNRAYPVKITEGLFKDVD
jgi:hypothetical protein